MSGWIKLYRSIEHCPALQADDAEGAWCRLLRMAARKPKAVNWKGQTVRLNTGQLCVSIRAWARERESSYKRVRTIFERFEREGMIQQRPIWGAVKGAGGGAVGLLVTICNYEQYQLSDNDRGAVEGAVEGAPGAQEGRTEQEREESKNRFLPPSPSGSTPLGRGVAGRANGSAKDGSRGTRIPDDWKPSAEGIAYAVELLGSDLTNETWITFRDYWRAKAGREARKASWPLTWKTWVRREHERLRERQARDERWRKSA